MPIYLVARVVLHAKECATKATLLIPKWPLAPFSPILFLDGHHMKTFVIDKEVIEKSDLVVHLGKLGVNLFKGAPNTIFCIAAAF